MLQPRHTVGRSAAYEVFHVVYGVSIAGGLTGGFRKKGQ